MKYFPFFLSVFSHLSSFAVSDKQKSCTNIDMRFVVTGSLSFVQKQCVLHPILNQKIYNNLIITEGFSPIEISDKEYSQLSIDSPYTEVLYLNDFDKNLSNTVGTICLDFNQKIVSSDNLNFYYIEDCKKRKFINYNDVQSFANDKTFDAIYAISEYQLDMISRGRIMWLSDSAVDLEQTDLQILETLPSRKKICNQVKAKAPASIVTYYLSTFYFQNCKLLPISALTIQMMQKAEVKGGIYELSTEEFLALQ